MITVGQLKTGNIRNKLYLYYKSKGCIFVTIISETSWVSKSAIIGEGTVALHRSVVNNNAKIGSNCIINTGAIIEHDVIIENNVHIAPGAIILGGAIIKKILLLELALSLNKTKLLSKIQLCQQKNILNK